MMSSTETSPDLKLLTARWLFPAVGPLQRDAGVLLKGNRIITIGDATSLQRDHPEAQATDFGDAIILPGLINAHTHLELSACAAGDSPASFVDWILSMPRRMGRQVNEAADDKFAAATQTGIAQCLRFGVTCVGDISQQMHVTRPLLAGAPLRAVSFGEVIGLGKRRPRFEELLPMALDDGSAGDDLRIGLSPHSPYTVEPGDLRRCLNLARERGIPLAIHLAETIDEEPFIRSHTGPLREMWEMLGSWSDYSGTFDGTPVAFAHALGLLDYPALLAHVNYCTDGDVALLARGNASVVYCPRTHRYFRHPPHRWREMLAAGVNVAVGTDSAASSPDLNLVDELRLLHEMAADAPVEMLWRMATVNAAKALQWERELTTSAADFVIFDVSTDQPLKEILESDRLPRQVWIKGNPVSPC